MYKKGKAFLCLRGARFSSPRLKSGASRRDVVNANKRIYVIGDVHGQFEKLAQLLRDTKLVGNTLSWTGGNATLWIMGDFFDRGPGGIAGVDLVMRLQEEAAAAACRVKSCMRTQEDVVASAAR